MKKNNFIALFYIFTCLFLLLGVNISYANENNKPQVLLRDKLCFNAFMEQAELLGESRKQLENDPNMGVNNMYTAYLLRRHSVKMKESSRILEIIYSHTKNIGLRNFFKVTFEGLREEGEAYLVGATLFEARGTNNTETISALATSIASKKVIHLVRPVASRVMLENRIQEFAQFAEFLHQEIMRNGSTAMNEIERDVMIALNKPYSKNIGDIKSCY